MWYFSLGLRLQRLFASETIATKMTWHLDYERADGVMIHPCDSEAWKHFDRAHPDFAKEHRDKGSQGPNQEVFFPTNPRYKLRPSLERHPELICKYSRLTLAL